MLFIPALFAVAAADPSALEFNVRRSSPKVAKRDSVLSATMNNGFGTGFVIDVGIGSPSQSLELNLDTFRQGLFVDCHFHPYNSSTYTSKEALHDDFNSTLSQDTLTVVDHEIDDIEFAYSDCSSSPLVYGLAPDPYLGIGLPNESDPYYHLSLPIQLKKQGLISVAAYSLYLNFFLEGGNILFGSIDSAKLASDLHKFPIVDDYNGYKSLSIALDGLHLYDTDGTHQKVADSSLSLSLHMHVPYSVLPWGMLEPLYAAFGVKCPKNDAKIDCGSLKNAGGVGLSFSGVEYDFSFRDVAVELSDFETFFTGDDHEEYNNWCIPGFAVMDSSRPIPFLGLNFLRLLYVVVDLENEEIGLAKGKFRETSSSYLEMSTGIPAPRAPGYRSEEPLQIMQPHSVTFGYSAPATHSPKSSSCSAKSSQMTFTKYSSGSPSDFYTDVHTTIGKGLASGVVSIHDSYDENSTAASSEKSSSNVSASTTGRLADTSGGNESASATTDRTTTSDTSRISESSKKTTSSAPSAKSTSARSPSSSSSASKSKDAAPKQAVSGGLATFGLLGVLALI